MTMPWYPHLVVAAIIERDGQFLMIEEISDGLRVINQPAGHVEQGESLVQAALRETLEETGWEVEFTSITGFYQYTSPYNGITYFRCSFNGVAVRDTGAELDQDVIGTRWMSYTELQQQQDRLRSPLVLRCIEDYLAGNRLPLDSVTYLEAAQNR